MAALAVVVKAGREARQVHVLGLGDYVGSPWNICDVAATLCVSVGLISFASGHGGFVQSWGAVGVLVLWLGLLDYFRAFESTGPLIRMIFQILSDIRPFLLVLLVGCVAFAAFFVIHQPLSDDFSVANADAGLVWPILSVYRITIGDFDIDDFQTSLTLVVFLLCSLFAASAPPRRRP